MLVLLLFMEIFHLHPVKSCWNPAILCCFMDYS